MIKILSCSSRWRIVALLCSFSMQSSDMLTLCSRDVGAVRRRQNLCLSFLSHCHKREHPAFWKAQPPKPLSRSWYVVIRGWVNQLVLYPKVWLIHIMTFLLFVFRLSCWTANHVVTLHWNHSVHRSKPPHQPIPILTRLSANRVLHNVSGIFASAALH